MKSRSVIHHRLYNGADFRTVEDEIETLRGGGLTNLNINPIAQGITVTPVTNAISTKASLLLKGSVAGGAREFVSLVDVINDKTGGDKVAGYFGVVGRASAAGPTSPSDQWALNTVTTLDASSGGSGANRYNAHGYELDLNNNFAHYGDDDSDLGKAVYGLAMTGAGDHRSTAAIHIASATGQIWNRGIFFSGDSIALSSFHDLSSSPTSLHIGGTHTYCLDMAASPTASQIRLRNNTSIVWRNAADDADLVALVGDDNNRLNIGASFAVVYTNASFAIVDGLGAPSTLAGYAQIFVDVADGDLKVKFGDGTLKTIVVDT